jgi:surface antigen
VTDHGSPAFRPNNTVTVHGTNSGKIASGNRDVTQLASTQSNMATADIAEIMRAVIEVAGSLNMADRDREELVRAAVTRPPTCGNSVGPRSRLGYRLPL